MKIQRDRPAKAYEWDRRFWEFHHENPWVMDSVVELVREDIELGLTPLGIDGYIIITRWRKDRQTRSRDQFKINDNHTSRYSRLIALRHPDLDGVFKTREGRMVRGFDPTDEPPS